MLTKALLAFLLGGLLCVVVQIIIDKTMLMPPRILVCAVVLGVILEAIGVYEPIKSIFGCGITVPLLGFGAVLAKGVSAAIPEKGPIGILLGGLSAASAGVSAALLSALLASLFFRSRPKKM